MMITSLRQTALTTIPKNVKIQLPIILLMILKKASEIGLFLVKEPGVQSPKMVIQF